MSATPINKKGFNDKGYIAGLNGQKIELYACSLAEAKQRAVEYFKPKKSIKHMVWVELAEPEESEGVTE